MPDYRLQPRKTGGYFAFLAALTVLVLGGPAAVVSLLPDHSQANEPVALTTLEFEEEVAGLSCPPNPDAESNGGWFCGDAVLDYYSYPDIKDETLLLRRMLRVVSSNIYPRVPTMDTYLVGKTPVTSGKASLLADPKAHAVAISLHGDGEHDKDFYVVTITGPQAAVANAAGKVWTSATHEDLPEAVRKELQEFDKYTVSDEPVGKLKENLPA